MFRRASKDTWLWGDYAIERCGTDAATERFELWCGTRFLQEFCSSQAAKTHAYALEGLPL